MPSIMTKFLRPVSLTLALFVGMGWSVWAYQGTGTSGSPPTRGKMSNPEENGIREAAKEFVEAFNKKDHAAVSGHWTEKGEYRNQAGILIKGRAAIAKSYESWFAGHEKPNLAMNIESIRFLSPDLAWVEGDLKFRSHPDGPVESSRFRSLQIRQGGKWLIGETTESSDGEVSVGALSWLLGTWKATDGEREVELRVTPWLDQGFFKADFQIKRQGKVENEGCQIIGKDLRTGGLRSWVFENQGGFGEGVWVHDGQRWDLEIEVMLQGGTTLQSVQVFSPIDKDSFLWQAIERQANGIRLPDTKPLKMQRAK